MHWIDLTDLTKLSYAALYSAMLFSGSMAKISVVLFGYQGIHFVFIIPHWRYVNIADSSWGGVSWHKLLDCIHLLFPIPFLSFQSFFI